MIQEDKLFMWLAGIRNTVQGIWDRHLYDNILSGGNHYSVLISSQSNKVYFVTDLVYYLK